MTTTESRSSNCMHARTYKLLVPMQDTFPKIEKDLRIGAELRRSSFKLQLGKKCGLRHSGKVPNGANSSRRSLERPTLSHLLASLAGGIVTFRRALSFAWSSSFSHQRSLRRFRHRRSLLSRACDRLQR
jgi:hypothetical protein